jgi:hypothetical protein
MTNETMSQHGYGYRYSEDPLRRDFPMRALMEAEPVVFDPPYKYHNDNGWWGDQGRTSRCVAFAGLHFLEDGPVGQRGPAPILDPDFLYHEAQKVDEWPGEEYEGTSVRAGLDILRKRGHRVVGPDGVAARPDINEGIIANRWAQNIEDVLRVLGYTGLDYVDVLNSWGRGYPHLTRMPASVLERLWREDGEVGLVTDR